MGKPSRDKGARFEREVVGLMQAQGFGAERVPLSGAAGGRFRCDVSFPFLHRDRLIECKVRADGFRELYSWLTDAWALVVKADRRKPLVVLPLDEFLRIAAIAEGRGKAEPERDAA